jgi:Ser/Thr protein kinase RdoA (MazF antagonist)
MSSHAARDSKQSLRADSLSLIEAVRRACAARGLNATEIRLLHHYSNAVMLVPHDGAVARVATGSHDVAQIKRSQDVTRWLVEEHDFPATQPLAGIDLVELDANTTVSFWVYYPQPRSPRPLTSAHMGHILADLHAITHPPNDLPRWIPLDSLNHALRDDTASLALNDTEREWLFRRISEVRDELTTLDWPLGHGLIHGDAWAGNLLWNPHTHGHDSVVLGDWDRIAHGPREVDLIPTWHAAHRYGKGPNWTHAFIHHYGHDLTTWPGLPTLLAMRDLAQISGPLRRAPHSPPHARALRQRLNDLRTGNTSTTWTAL